MGGATERGCRGPTSWALATETSTPAGGKAVATTVVATTVASAVVAETTVAATSTEAAATSPKCNN